MILEGGTNYTGFNLFMRCLGGNPLHMSETDWLAYTKALVSFVFEMKRNSSICVRSKIAHALQIWFCNFKTQLPSTGQQNQNYAVRPVLGRPVFGYQY